MIEVATRPAPSGPPPRFAGALPLVGHMAKFARDPVAMMITGAVSVCGALPSDGRTTTERSGPSDASAWRTSTRWRRRFTVALSVIISTT